MPEQQDQKSAGPAAEKKAAKKAPRKRSAKKKAPKKAAKKASKAKAKKLVIVESPAKARTIGRYLGDDYTVRACRGHVRDLPKKRLGVDLENGFAPEYVDLKGKGVPDLRKLARKAEAVYLAPDLDREGEAIAWHLFEALKLAEENTFRVTFNEITKPAIQRAFETPGRLDMDKVEAQQARRILDRVVGYQLSPLLWKKVAKGLSAGRVQSVAVKLIVERELEIKAFVPEEYWKVTARLAPEGLELPAPPNIEKVERLLGMQGSEAAEKPPLAEGEFEADLAGRLRAAGDGEKCPGCSSPMKFHETKAGRTLRCTAPECKTSFTVVSDGRVIEPVRLGDEASAKSFLAELEGSDWRILDLRERNSRSRPKPPFTTSLLQQAAATRLHFPAEKTMRIAQQLYEGVAVGGASVGLITYMRTDSFRVADSAVAECRAVIEQDFGTESVPAKPQHYKSRGRAQGAHEAIRPTSAERRPDLIASSLSEDQRRLYDLIWRRFVACQMEPALFHDTSVVIEAAGSAFRASGHVMVFPGHLAAYPSTSKDEKPRLPKMEKGGGLDRRGLFPSQHFTQPPPRYTEASLVRTLEREGIGRPSTYAAIISTVQRRGYALRERGAFRATELGQVVTAKLVEFFPELLDTRFTARMEDELDRVEEGDYAWRAVLEEFYGPFSKDLAEAKEKMESAKGMKPEKEIACPECGKPMLVRFSKRGKFLGCSGFPDCRVTMPLEEGGDAPIELSEEAKNAKCDLCGGDMVLKSGRRGPFLACSNYPDCRFTMDVDSEGNVSKPEKIDVKCEECGKPMIVRSGRRGKFLGCSGYPECRNTMPMPGTGGPAKGATRKGGAGGGGRRRSAPQTTDIDCPQCGKKLVVRSGRRGKFLGCKGYPDCRHTQDLPPELEG